MALIDNLVSFWQCDEASGNLLDAHGSNNLTDNNTVTSTTGKIGNARRLTRSSSEYFSIADNAGLRGGDRDFSMALFIRLRGNAGDYPGIVAKYSFPSSLEYLVSVTPDNTYFFEVTSNGTESDKKAVSANTTVSLNTWNHLAVAHDSINNQLKIWLNGTLTTSSMTTGVFAGSATFNIGGRPQYFGAYVDIDIDLFGFWGRTLINADVSDLYNGGNGLAYPFITGQPSLRRYRYSDLRLLRNGREGVRVH